MTAVRYSVAKTVFLYFLSRLPTAPWIARNAYSPLREMTGRKRTGAGSGCSILLRTSGNGLYRIWRLALGSYEASKSAQVVRFEISLVGGICGFWSVSKRIHAKNRRNSGSGFPGPLFLLPVEAIVQKLRCPQLDVRGAWQKDGTWVESPPL